MTPSQTSLASLLCACLILSSFVTPCSAQKRDRASFKGYGPASYSGLPDGSYLKTWLIAGPFMLAENGEQVSDELQKKIFSEDDELVVEVPAKASPGSIQRGSKIHEWTMHAAKGLIINLDSLYNKDFAYVYALAELITDTPRKTFMAVGSDDGVRVWLNGKLVHSNWTARALVPDEDVFPVTLNKGSNQLIIKVQDVNQDWGFSARFLDKAALSERLILASEMGDLDMMKALLDGGADVDHKDQAGLTALGYAKINGRKEAEKLLLDRGAQVIELPASEVLIDNLYEDAKKPGPGVAVLVAQDGKVLYTKGFGYADIDKKIPVTPETKFRIGSVSKQFTAAAILKLAEDGKLKLDDKLSDYITDFPRGNEVTIHHLLTHTSGIHSYTNKPDFISKVTSPITPDELISSFKNDPYDFNPGDSYLYNNSGYFLLGYIISKVSKMSYDAYLSETFFKPLNMTNTGSHSAAMPLQHEAMGYSKANGKFDKSINWDMSWAGGAGALYSTVGDLLKWNEALYNGKILTEESLKKALTPVVLNNGQKPGSDYGYGLQMDTYRGLRMIHHGGGLHGFLSQLAWYPDEKMTVVILTNVAPAEVNLNTNTIVNYYLWDKLEAQRSYSVSNIKQADLSLYAGRYDFAGGAIMTITVENDGLYAQLSGQGRFPIFPAGEDEFFWKVVEARIKFLKDENGKVTSGKFWQNGNELVIKRLEDQKVVSIDTALLKDYAGRYDFANGAVLSITQEDEGLFAQLTGQPKFQIFPASETDFFWKVVSARITFVRDQSGQVTHGLFEQGGNQIKTVRIKDEK